MKEKVLPAEWKSTNISPVFKKGSRLEAGNYRPINLASVPAKIMESMIKDHILDHLRTNNCLLRSQHGFLPGRSCTSNLVEYLNMVTKTIDNGYSFDAVLVDFKRAFDKVPFDGMLVKARAHGITGDLLAWLENWTMNRKQRVVLNGMESEWLDVTSSVVQGSVLGPILFLMYINDLDVAILSADNEIFISKFADDTKLGRKIASVSDCLILQRGIDKLSQWCLDWGMSLHPDKCVVLHFGRKNPNYDYTIDNILIKSECVARDLGVLVSDDCKPSMHVQKVAKKAHVVLSQVRRAIKLRNSKTLLPIYKSFIRPLLESSVQAWNPAKRADVDTLEKVQKRAVRLMSDQSSRSYEDRLSNLQLQSLEDRRHRGDMIETFKIIHGHNDVAAEGLFSFVRDRHNKDTRSFAENRLVPEKSSLDIRKSFFACRVVEGWNRLPLEVKNAPSTNAFKNSYDGWIDLQM